MPRATFYILFNCFFFTLFSQTPKPDKLKQISLADSVFFTVTTSGCIDSGTIHYILVKNKNNERVLIEKKGATKKKLTMKNYDVFIYRFRQSAQRFKYADENEKKCTLMTSFILSDKKRSITFANTSCESEYNPEEVLKQLAK